MSTARERREAARAKLEMRMAEKQAVAQRKRRVTITLASILALVVVVGLGWFVVSLVNSATGDEAAPKDDRVESGDGAPKDKVVMEALSMSDPAAASKGEVTCKYKDVKPGEDGQKNPNLKDVGTPDKKQPNTGTQKMTIDLKQGEVVAEIDNAKAPCTAASYTYLAGKSFFDDSKCHRLTTKGIFVLQCGDPTGTGSGGPNYQFDNEYTPKDTAKDLTKKEQEEGTKQPKPNYKAGTLAMANAGEDTNGSQFFIVYEDSYLPPNYTILGKITSGLDVVRDIAKKGAWITKEQQQQQQMGGGMG